jgi:hypothetical protein
MIERQSLLNFISDRLAIIKSKVEISNPTNLTDVNIISENFYRDLLNIVFGYKLINLNIIAQNAPAIDLGDSEKRIAFQVTSTSTLAKTRKTVTAFISNKLYETYDRLIILNITVKSNHQEEFVGELGTYQLSTKNDIWDVSDLYKVICDLTTKQIQQVSDFLKAEIKIGVDQTIAKEIRTFISLIEIISDEGQRSAGTGFIEAPDPEKKISRRFADYADYLRKEYQDLYTEYGQVLIDVLAQPDIGHVRIRRLGLHLKSTSDSVLNECDGDATRALSKLVLKYNGLLSENGSDFDEGAIKFFLVDQLIKCNVFPNKVTEHA